MASKNGVQTSIDSIFLAAMDLFRENGYIKTNIRQISERAGVSLGLVNHYFGSKRDLGYAVLETLIKYVMLHTEEYLGDRKDPLLTDATETRAVNLYLMSGPFRQFYMDTLEEDIFFSYLEHRPDYLVEQLQDVYGYTISHDMALLYSRYIPYMVEKTLVLKKNEGLFPSIDDEEIPYRIFISTYAGLVPQQVLAETDRCARALAPQIVKDLLPSPDYQALVSNGLLPFRKLGI